MATKREILDKSDEIEELFREKQYSVSKIANELNLREKTVSKPSMVTIGPPKWVLKVDCPSCGASGGFTKRKREQCDIDGMGVHSARIEKAEEEGYRPDPLDEELEGGDVTEYIAFEVLGFDDWDEYNRERNKVRQTQRRESGFTEKKKQEIRDRDGNQCVLCLSPDKIHVHHIDEDATNNDSDNLVTLCERCHNRVHSLKNRYSNRTKGDFIGELVEEGHKQEVVSAVLREVFE